MLLRSDMDLQIENISSFFLIKLSTSATGISLLNLNILQEWFWPVEGSTSLKGQLIARVKWSLMIGRECVGILHALVSLISLKT